MGWEPARYLRFAQPRLHPAIDLLAMIMLGAPGTVYDLGCGAGNVTRRLAERWPDGRAQVSTNRPWCPHSAGTKTGDVVHMFQSGSI